MAADENTRLSEADHTRITAAIREAENHTSGEIFAVVAHASDDYFYVAGFWAALWSMVLGLACALVLPLLDYAPDAWTITALSLASLAVFLLAFAWRPGLRLYFVPRSIAYRRAHGNAMRQFLAHGIHTTAERSGVLVFVSLAEHYAEIVADAGINDKVDQARWDAMVEQLTVHAARDELVDGFVTVVADAGSLLAQHFPPMPEPRNELDDRLVEI